jgi:hypothetical protein
VGGISIWHWLVLAIVAVIAASVWFLTKKSRKSPTVGIGGWLVLPVIGFFGTALLTGSNLVLALKDTEGLVAIYSGDIPQYLPLRLPVLLSSVFGFLVLASASLSLFLIFSKRPQVRMVASLHYGVLAVAGLVELWANGVVRSIIPEYGKDASVASDALRGVLAAMIWIPYFQFSKRVRNTFEGTSNASIPVAVAAADQDRGTSL